ncbi:dienelactone hydrolase family protein [Streptomyces sp. BYX5S]
MPEPSPTPLGRRGFVTGAAAAALATAAGAGGAGQAQAAEPVGGNLPAFHPLLKQELNYPLAWGTSPIRDFGTWRRTARATFEDLLLVDRQSDVPYAPRFEAASQGDGYSRQLVDVALTRYERVRGALLTPDGPGPFPAVLLLHDHGARFDIGKEKFVRPWYDDTRLTSAEAWADTYFTGRFVGDELARRGYVVLCFDAYGWGDRGPVAYDQQQALASNFYNLGSSLAGLMAREDARAAAFLAGLDRVDSRRVAAVGFSMGGYRAWQTAALSDAVAAAVSVCWMTGLKEMMVPGNNTLRGQSSYYMLHPGLARHLDIPDVASLAAPRPMYLLDGADDTLFTREGVDAAYARMRTVWHSRHAPGHLRTETWPDLGHVFVQPMQDAVFTWLDRTL